MVILNEPRLEPLSLVNVESVSLGKEICRNAPLFSLIIPIYNETDIVLKNLETVDRFLKNEQYELIICDDCSQDGTYNKLEAFAGRSRNQNILLMRSNARIGKGGSVKRAVKEALGSVIVIMDLDLSVDLKCIPEMVKLARTSRGVVIGQRSAFDRSTQGPLRVILSFGYNSLARILFRTGVKDHQCGFKAMDADVARELADKTKNDGYVFDTELIVLAGRLNIPVIQVHTRWVDGRPRKSNLRWIKTGFIMMKDLVMIKRDLA